jgi:hypothetical protein
MNIWLFVKAIAAVIGGRFDARDGLFLLGVMMLTLGLACYSIPMALVAVGAVIIGLTLYSAR